MFDNAFPSLIPPRLSHLPTHLTACYFYLPFKNKQSPQIKNAKKLHKHTQPKIKRNKTKRPVCDTSAQALLDSMVSLF